MRSRRVLGVVLVSLCITLLCAVVVAVNFSLSATGTVADARETGGPDPFPWFWTPDGWPAAYGETRQSKLGYSIVTRSTIGSQRLDEGDPPPAPPWLWQTAYRAGWPFAALERRDWTNQPALPMPRRLGPFIWNGFRGGMLIELGGQTGVWRAVPLIPAMPYWPGLIGDFVFWGGVWWLVRFGAERRVRRKRVRMGWCIACGYDMKGLPTCPECGGHREAAGPHATIPA